MASWRWAVWWCAGWAALAAPAAGESFLNDIGRNLRAEMAGVLEMAVVNYSEPVLNVTYVASVEFDMRAMGAIYNATPVIIDAIARKQAYPEGMVTVVDGHVELPEGGLRTHWRPLLAHYAGPTAVLAVALLLVAALPLAGLFWCCCYWCRGGQRRRPFDRKYDACLKAMLAILLIGFLTLFLFGIVCAFATDSQAEEGLAGAGGATRAALRDAKAFIDASQRHADHLLVKNYQELEKKLNAILTSCGLTISVQLGEFSRAVSVTALTGMVRRLDVVRTDLRTVQALTVSLRSNAERLNAALRSVRAQLLETLARCSQPQCIQLQEKHKIGELDTEIHYSQMPDVSELLGNVTALLESNIKAEVEEGQNVFRNIQREVQRSVDEHIPSVQDAVAEAGRKLAQAAADLKRVADEASGALDEQHVFADSIDNLYRQYGPYRRYVGIGAATALLTVMALVSWGLLCGVCGKRPDVYGASDCCNKGAGSKSLLCGTGLMFAVGGAAALVLAAYFAVGVAAQRFVCDPLTEPRGNRVFRDLEKFVKLDEALFGRGDRQPGQPEFNLTYVLLNCHQNHTIYQTFQLSRRYDLPSLQAAVADEVSRRARLLGPPRRRREPLVILKESAKSKLRQLAATGLSEFDFDRILHALETNMTSLALDGLAAQLEAAARALAPRPAFAAVADSLASAAAKLRMHHRDILMPMINDTQRLNQTALKLRDSLRFNHSSLKEAIAYLMHETQQAEAFLNERGPDLVQNMTLEFAEVVAALMTQYMERVSNAALHDVGRCGPLSNAFNSTRDAHCRKILMPVNGYWVSLAWCLALSVAVMALSARLARLYRNLDPYPGPLVEAEYLYDAYADRDNVPLANGSKRSTLDIEGKIAEWRRALPSAPPADDPAAGPGGGPGSVVAGAVGPVLPAAAVGEAARTALVLEGAGVVCALLPPPEQRQLIDEFKTRLPVKDEDNESGIHDAE